MTEKQPNIEVAVKSENGQVILNFSKLINHLEMKPENCISIAEAMTSSAFEAMHRVKPVGDTLKAALVERHREKLIPRIALMLNGMDRISNGEKALKIMDAICAEVFS